MNNRRMLASTLVLLLVVPPALAQAPRPVAPQQFPGIADPGLFEESMKAAIEAVKQYGTRDNPADVARVNRIAYELAEAFVSRGVETHWLIRGPRFLRQCSTMPN